jgi:hypothetical protein
MREATRRLSGEGMFEEDEAEEQTSELERAAARAHVPAGPRHPGRRAARRVPRSLR